MMAGLPGLNVLLLGSGGREHAMAAALAKSPRLGRLYAAPGNPGMAALAECLALDPMDFGAVIASCKRFDIGLVVVGPEAPLCAGIVDALTAAGIPAFGPTRAAAQLEGSKGFTKDLCARHDIPTAAYRRFEAEGPARAYLADAPIPIVVKADGLAAGKGVTVAMSRTEALEAVGEAFAGRFGAAGSSVVIEEFLTGEEASVFALVDGTRVLPFGTAQDHKRAFDGDEGPNTGGMGAYSPAPVMTADLTQRVMTRIIEPTARAMAAEGYPFRGILYAGLMIAAEGPKLIEYNVRLGDPEAQVILPRLKSDFLSVLLEPARAKLEWREDAALTVVLANRGYPGPYSEGSVIKGIERAEALGAQVFHAGTARADGAVIAKGGRVLDVTALAPSITEAQRRAYQAVDAIDWPEGFCRRDIGWRAIERERARR
jgi:phosphoribosylamine--glycine ligase